jgi:predicted phosphodiesterase
MNTMIKSFLVVGDIHGQFRVLKQIAETNPDKIIIQIGDFGVGFISNDILEEHMPANVRFFVGNHDSRQEANKLAFCLGDFGEYEQFFFVSGANSIDKDIRTPGLNWWHDEELNYKQCNDCLKAWKKSKLEILLTHDCPQSIAENYFLIYDKSDTRILLEEMIKARKPKRVIFGHHHKKFKVIKDNIEYICLPELATLEINT